MVPLRDYLQPQLIRTVRAASPYTLMSYARLRTLWAVAGSIRVPGAVVECGTYKGGSAAVLARRALGRSLWLFDSWEGCPEPSAVDVDARGRSGRRGDFQASETEVRQLLFDTLAHDEDRIHLVRGWFDETIPSSKHLVGPIALLHLDGDWYESTFTCLSELYDLVVVGGVVIIDDYGEWSGCRKAADDFFAIEHVDPAFLLIDGTQAVHVRR